MILEKSQPFRCVYDQLTLCFLLCWRLFFRKHDLATPMSFAKITLFRIYSDNDLNLLPLSGISHSNILAIFLLYYSWGTLHARRELTLESRFNRDASRLAGSQMTCSVFFGIQTQCHETSWNLDNLRFLKILLAVSLCVWLILALMIRPWFTIQLH